jgi:hypothetical protein
MVNPLSEFGVPGLVGETCSTPMETPFPANRFYAELVDPMLPAIDVQLLMRSTLSVSSQNDRVSWRVFATTPVWRIMQTLSGLSTVVIRVGFGNSPNMDHHMQYVLNAPSLDATFDYTNADSLVFDLNGPGLCRPWRS